MAQVCLDTDILIEFLKGKREIGEVISKYDEFYISVISVYEFMRGADEEKTKEMNSLDLDYNVAILASAIYKKLHKSGDLISDNDILIAASCILKDIPLLTLNKKHFERLKRFGLKLV